MSSSAPQEIFRKDYARPGFAVQSANLCFQLNEEEVLVTSTLCFKRITESSDALFLHGEGLDLRKIQVDGVALATDVYEHSEEGLTIFSLPATFTLETVVAIRPQDNTQLSGLYQSSGNFCTQCEAEGFRRITFFMDRPDVMTVFAVRIEADKIKYPVLLSNGNKVEAGELEGGRHFTVWEDPFKKPSYLFALVAGDFGFIQDSFTTCSGKNVDLYIYSEHGNEDKLTYAMHCLQKSMKWDEDVFGLEYDLGIYNVVAVSDFNMGAMENKSLNVFNTAYVLARPDTATDADYEGIDGVIAHEYFHNWTGNRVTCRDWFQLTLKEGLTVFRDECYSADQTSAAVKRIEDVRSLRSFQFPEDAGPMAHPIRPESYVAMDNFYTSTVYSKGAEVIRMIETVLGKEGFRKGMDLYFERHDGQAVTCDDFRSAMADANDTNLDAFERWYLQAGTPTLHAEGHYDAGASTYTLHLRQSCGATPGQAVKEPFPIPVAVGLLGKSGKDLLPTRICLLEKLEESFCFEGVAETPILSLLRDFSAPVKLEFEESDKDLAFCFAHDSDSFNRWEAGQKLATRELLAAASEKPVASAFSESFGKLLKATGMDDSLKAYALRLPALATLAEEVDVVNPSALATARRDMVQSLAKAHEESLLSLWKSLAPSRDFVHNPAEAGRRRLRNTCLAYLTCFDGSSHLPLAQEQLNDADNMTDQFSALACLVDTPGPESAQALKQFYAQWKGEALVVDKWLSVQAGADREDTLECVDALLSHEAFDMKNPNKARSLIRVFFRNLPAFHRPDGKGYTWIADRVIQLDAINPQIAARMAGAFGAWRRMEPGRQALMKAELERMLGADKLSKDTWEIIHRTLAAPTA